MMWHSLGCGGLYFLFCHQRWIQTQSKSGVYEWSDWNASDLFWINIMRWSVTATVFETYSNWSNIVHPCRWESSLLHQHYRGWVSFTIMLRCIWALLLSRRSDEKKTYLTKVKDFLTVQALCDTTILGILPFYPGSEHAVVCSLEFVDVDVKAEGWTQRFNYLLHLHPFQGSRGAAANLSSHWPRSNRLWTLNRSITQTHIETNNQSHWVNSYSWNNQILVRAQTTALLIVVFLFFLHAIKSPHSQGFKHKDAACGQLCQKKTLPDKGRNEIFFYLIITN